MPRMRRALHRAARKPGSATAYRRLSLQSRPCKAHTWGLSPSQAVLGGQASCGTRMREGPAWSFWCYGYPSLLSPRRMQ